ncbi:hypothetical protein SAMN05720354_107136 [Nitrosospira sp. Nsp1]|nr:hypothetical protein SAMN05720354_107136 [Nitrosospira sp. Nsp1]
MPIHLRMCVKSRISGGKSVMKDGSIDAEACFLITEEML